MVAIYCRFFLKIKYTIDIQIGYRQKVLLFDFRSIVIVKERVNMTFIEYRLSNCVVANLNLVEVNQIKEYMHVIYGFL